VLVQFYYKITYRLGKENAIADILSRKDELIPTQQAAKEAKRTRVIFLVKVILVPIKGFETIDNLRATEEALRANRTDLSFTKDQAEALRKTAS
jgi:hypothetical protein